MSVRTQDIFGAGSEQPAVAGSYGEHPTGHRLPDATRLGRAVLQVSNLERSLRYYEQVLGLRELARHGQTALLAAHGDDRVLLELREQANVLPVGRGRLGLYHFAILLPERVALGRFVKHLSEIGARAGASDHMVSEALYLTDPDGLGIEVYADRPRETWKRVATQLKMASDPLDLRSLFELAGDAPFTGLPAGTVMGHVHLHVGDIAKGSAFYSEGIGFDRIVWSYPGAMFFSAGGYHHHLGTNTWAGPQAQPAPDTEAKLLEWTIELPSSADVDAVAVNVAKAGFAVTREDDDALLRDPWGTMVRVTARGA